MKIAVVVDSGCGFDKKEIESKGIFYLPLQIIDGDKSYEDGIEVTCEDVFTMIHEGKMMKTSLPPMGYMRKLFKDIKKDGYDHVIAVTLTSGLSGTMQAVKLACEEEGIEVSMVETWTTCYIQAYIAFAAKRLVDEGKELDEILALLNDSIEHSNTLVIPEDLDHLKRGGRLTPAAAALAGMLKIKPIVSLNKNGGGKLDTFAKVRTMSKALQKAVDAYDDVNIDENYIVVVLHADAPENAKETADYYFDKYPKSEHINGLIGPVISVHTGVGCVGVQYIKKV